MLLVWFISCQILSWIWKRLKASVLPTPLTRNEQKHLPKAAQQRDSAPITNTGYLKLQRAISSTLSLLLMAFPPTTTTPNTWGNTTFFNHTPVASQCILIAADWNSTAHITCQRKSLSREFLQSHPNNFLQRLAFHPTSYIPTQHWYQTYYTHTGLFTLHRCYV